MSPQKVAENIKKIIAKNKKVAFNCYMTSTRGEGHAITITIDPKYDYIGIWDNNGDEWKYVDWFPTYKLSKELNKKNINWLNLNHTPLYLDKDRACYRYTGGKLKELTLRHK